MRARSGFELTSRPAPVNAWARDVWGSRNLIRLLARKDFFARYRRASLGIVWAIGVPLIQAAVLAVVFSRVVRIEVNGNYGIFVFSGIIPWMFLYSAMQSGASSIIDGSNLAAKIYFPRAVMPLVSVGSELYGLVSAMVVLLVGVVALGPGIDASVVFLVPALLLLLVLSASFAMLLAAIQVYFRDARYLLQAFLRAWFYATPVIYPLDRVPGGVLRKVIEINPATGVIELFRAATFGPDPGWEVTVAWAAAWAVLAMGLAVVLHRHFDRLFTDLL